MNIGCATDLERPARNPWSTKQGHTSRARTVCFQPESRFDHAEPGFEEATDGRFALLPSDPGTTRRACLDGQRAQRAHHPTFRAWERSVGVYPGLGSPFESPSQSTPKASNPASDILGDEDTQLFQRVWKGTLALWDLSPAEKERLWRIVSR